MSALEQQPAEEEWCYSHQDWQRRWSQDFRYCRGCGHVFRTEYELISEQSRMLARRGDEDPGIRADEIRACPICGERFH